MSNASIDETDFTTKAGMRDKEGSTQPDDIILVNITHPTWEHPRTCVKEILTVMKEKIDSNKVIVGDLAPH